MGQLTWKNVAGDDTNAGTAALKQAGSLFNKAFDSASGAVVDREKRTVDDNTNRVLDDLRRINNTKDFDAASDNFNIDDIDRQFDGKVDTNKISQAFDKLRPELERTEQADAARLLNISDAEYNRSRGRANDIRADQERIKQQGIDTSVGDLLASNQATEDYTQQQYQEVAGQSEYVSIQNGTPVFADISNLPAEQQEIAKSEQATARETWAQNEKLKGTMDQKQLIANLTKSLRDQNASDEQISSKVANLKQQEKERTSLSGVGQQVVASQEVGIRRLADAAKQQAGFEKEETLRANPIGHTLNAEGQTSRIGDVHKKIRAEYPRTSWLGGTGGDSLSQLVGSFSGKGITRNGAKGIKGTKGTAVVEPWMLMQAMDIAGQTPGDAWGNPTLGTKLFKEVLADIAFDPQYKEYEQANNLAKRTYNQKILSIGDDVDSQVSSLYAAQRKAEKQVNRGTSREFLQTLQNSLRKY